MTENLTAIIQAIVSAARNAAARIESVSNGASVPQDEKRNLRSIARFLKNLASAASKGDEKAIYRLCVLLGLKSKRLEYDNEKQRIEGSVRARTIQEENIGNNVLESQKEENIRSDLDDPGQP